MIDDRIQLTPDYYRTRLMNTNEILENSGKYDGDHLRYKMQTARETKVSPRVFNEIRAITD
jgi:hypothetical protein